MKYFRSGLQLLFFTAILFLSGCCKKYFPLCPKLANTKRSSEIDNVGKVMLEACKKHHITIEVLSSNIAIFRGTKRQMRWLEANYHILLCDFDQENSVLGANEYTSCLSHAKNWIAMIETGNFEDLMKSGTIYCPVCVPNQMCH
jgi:hypothetical protein